MEAESKISSLFTIASLLLITLATIAWGNSFPLILNFLFSAWAAITVTITIAWFNHAYSIVYFGLHDEL